MHRHRRHPETDELVSQQSSFRQRIFYSRPGKDDVQGQDYDVAGRITAQALVDLGAGANAHYLLCGPARFLSDIRTGLEATGVPAENIQFEAFGPG